MKIYSKGYLIISVILFIIAVSTTIFYLSHAEDAITWGIGFSGGLALFGGVIFCMSCFTKPINQ